MARGRSNIEIDWREVDRKMNKTGVDSIEMADQTHPNSVKTRLVPRWRSNEDLLASGPKELNRIVQSWDEQFPGKFGYLRYYGFWHAVLITEKDEERSIIKAVHYGCPDGLLGRRTVVEEEFIVDLARKDLWEVVIPEAERVSPEVAVRNAQRKIEEQRFNMFTRRSSHVVRECLKKRHSE